MRRRFLFPRVQCMEYVILCAMLLIFPHKASGQELPQPIATFSFPNPFKQMMLRSADANGRTNRANESDPATASPNRPRDREGVTFKTVPMDILRDQKYIWLFPLQVMRGHHLLPTVAIAGLTAGLVVADRYDMPYFYHTTQFNGFNEVFTKTSTEVMMAIAPVSLLVFGLTDHNKYAEQTAILSGEAYIDSAIPHVAMKFVARRLRPDSPELNGNYSDTFFRSNLSVFSNGSSFPSGHAAGAFAIAAVIARRYGSHRWVPWAAYGFATLLSFSRIPSRGHYPSEVFLGAAMGYAIARYDIFREQ